MTKALFVGGPWHGQVRDVDLGDTGRFPTTVDDYGFWRFSGGGRDWPYYAAPGTDQAELTEAVGIAGWPRWGTPAEEALRPVRRRGGGTE